MVRRIRRSEQQLLKELCNSDSHWEKYFREHKIWLKEALSDVKSEGRVVYGVFESKYEEGDRNDDILVACIFLKLSKFDSCIEFKNIILPKYNFTSNDQIFDLAKRLIDAAVRFCEVRNILKIEIDLPHEEHSLIGVFLTLNFKVVAIREKYIAGQSICTLERSIGENYYGDPFDGIKIAHWLLRCYFPAIIDSIDYQLECHKITFTAKPVAKSFSIPNSTAYKKLVNGVLWILEEEESIDDIDLMIESSRPCAIIIIAAMFQLSQADKEQLTKKGVVVFDKDELYDIAGGELSSMQIPMIKQEIGGVITVLEQERILGYARQKDMTYFLLSGIHDGIELFDEDEDENEEGIDVQDDRSEICILALYCPNWYDKGAGIVGVGIIYDIDRDVFNKILDKTHPANSALSREDLAFYKTFSENERVGVVAVKKIKLFEKPLPIGKGDWISNESIRTYLLNQIGKNDNNCAYLDFDTANNLLKKSKKSGYTLPPEPIDQDELTLADRKFRVGVSFSGNLRPLVEEVVQYLTKKLGSHTVFYDYNYQAELAVGDLDIFLGDIYKHQCDLIIPFFTKDYETREWCNLEWSNIREILMDAKEKGKLMAFKEDGVVIKGFPKHHGFVSINNKSAPSIADLILQRLSKMPTTKAKGDAA